MFRVFEKTTAINVIKNSKFIAVIVPVFQKEEIPNLLKQIKEEYKNANHYCYSYIIDQEVRVNDDKEPNKTAGIPILSVLRHYKLNHTLAVVIRYFGGIKLGPGGLMRAYSKTVDDALKNTTLVKDEALYSVLIKVPKEKQKWVDELLQNTNIRKSYQESLLYQTVITETQKELLDQNQVTYQIEKSQPFSDD